MSIFYCFFFLSFFDETFLFLLKSYEFSLVKYKGKNENHLLSLEENIGNKELSSVITFFVFIAHFLNTTLLIIKIKIRKEKLILRLMYHSIQKKYIVGELFYL